MRIQIGDHTYRVDKCEQLSTQGRLAVLSLSAQIERHLKKEKTRCARASQKTCKIVTFTILSDQLKLS